MSKKTVVKRLLGILLMVLVVLGTMPIQGGAVFAEGDEQTATVGTFTVEVPVCGTEIKVVEGEIINSTQLYRQENKPVVTASQGSHFKHFETTDPTRVTAVWLKNYGIDESTAIAGNWLDTTVVGGEDYLTVFFVTPNDGYQSPTVGERLTMTVNGVSAISGTTTSGARIVYANLKAVHDPGDWEEKEGDSSKQVKKCKHCGEVLEEKDSPLTLTIHWSDVDETDHQDPIVISVASGTTVKDAVSTIDKSYGTHWDYFEEENYDAFWAYFATKPFSDFADYSQTDFDTEVDSVLIDGDATVDKDMDVYFYMMQPIAVVPEFTVTAPVCGDSTTTPKDGDEWNWDAQTNPPKASVKGENYTLYHHEDELSSAWLDSEDWSKGFDPYIGSFVGDEEYVANVWLETKVGYYFPDEKVTVGEDGELVDSFLTGAQTLLCVIAKVKAVHDWEEGYSVEWNADNSKCTATKACKGDERHTITETVKPTSKITKEPTCEEDGEETFTATFENDLFDEETITQPVDALGHDYGDWTETKAATVDAEGEETRTCSRCGNKETRSVPKLEPEDPSDEPSGDETVSYSNTEGNGSSWTKGSTDTLTFTFKRNTDDELTYGHFVRALVDNTEIDPSKYKKSSGSIKIELLPSYLETLAVGEHTLTAVFSEGKNATATFTILEEKSSTPDKKTPSNTDNSKSKNAQAEKKSAKKNSPRTGDENNPVLWFVLMTIAIAIHGAFVIRNKIKDASK